MKAGATALLLVAAVVYVLARRAGGHGWVGYVETAAEAGMVGGLADWFAVTALFRIGCEAIIAPLSMLWEFPRTPVKFKFMMLTGLVIASFLVSMCYILRIVYRITPPRGWAIGLVWIMISWLVPIIIEDMAASGH